MITVACKLPNGLQLKLADKPETVVTLNGTHSSGAVLGYGMTEVDPDFFEAWLKEVGADYAPVKRGLIFAAKSANDARAKATEQSADITNGFEGADPTKEGVEPTEEMKQELAKNPPKTEKPKA